MSINTDDLKSSNTPMRWRIQGKRIEGTSEESMLEENYLKTLKKAATFTSDEEFGVGNQPGGGDIIEPDPILVSGVSITGDVEELEIAGTVTLGVNITPSTADDKTVTWSTSDAAVATVANGLVTGVAEGIVNITAVSNDANKSKDIVEIIIV